MNVDYPLLFINSVIKQFNDKLSEKPNEEDDYILPTNFFEIKKQFILTDVLYCEKNKTSSIQFFKKFHKLTNDLCEIKKKEEEKTGSPKMTKFVALHSAYIIYEGICTCKENYICETKRNVEI